MAYKIKNVKVAPSATIKTAMKNARKVIKKQG